MKLTVRINYHTSWGESLWICGSIKALGKWDENMAYPMIYIGNGEWEAVLNFKSNKTFEYKYFLKSSNNRFWESGINRTFNFENNTDVDIRDFWRPQVDPRNTMLSKVFTHVLMKPDKSIALKSNTTYNKAICFKLREALVPKGKHMAIIGNTTALGNWKKPIKLNNTEYPGLAPYHFN